MKRNQLKHILSIVFLLNLTAITSSQFIEHHENHECPLDTCHPDAVLPVYQKSNNVQFYAFKDRKIWLFEVDEDFRVKFNRTVDIDRLFPNHPSINKINTAFVIGKRYYLVSGSKYWRYEIDSNDHEVFEGHLPVLAESGKNATFVNAINLNFHNGNELLFKTNTNQFFYCKFTPNQINAKETEDQVTCQPVDRTLLSDTLDHYRTYTHLKNGNFIGFTDQQTIIKSKVSFKFELRDHLMHIETIDSSVSSTVCSFDLFCRSYDFIPLQVICKDGKCDGPSEITDLVNFHLSPLWIAVFAVIALILIFMSASVIYEAVREKSRLPIIRRSYTRLRTDTAQAFIIS